MSNFGSWRDLTNLTASSMIESVRRPRKSTLRRPSFGQTSPSYCVVTTSDFAPLASGVYMTTGSLVIKVPAACTPVLRLRPSSLSESSSRRLTCGSLASSSISGLCMASCRYTFGPMGIFLASSLICISGMSRTRPTSRMTALAPSELKVMICATHSFPYFSRTYAMTRSRPVSAKSMSRSGMDLRSGFRKRSNSRRCSSGSAFVMRNA